MHGGQPPITEALWRLGKDCPLSEHAKILCHIRPDFWEILDNNVLTDEDNKRVDFYVDSKSDFDGDSDEYEDEEDEYNAGSSFAHLFICSCIFVSTRDSA